MSCATEIKTNVASTRRATAAITTTRTTAKAKRNKVKKFFDELRNLPIALRLAVKTITRNKKTVCCGGEERKRGERRLQIEVEYRQTEFIDHDYWRRTSRGRVSKGKRDEDAPDDWQVQAKPRVSLEWSYLSTTCYRYPPPSPPSSPSACHCAMCAKEDSTQLQPVRKPFFKELELLACCHITWLFPAGLPGLPSLCCVLYLVEVIHTI